MFKKNIIRNRVMEVVENKIAQAQEEHDNELEGLENELDTTITGLHAQFEVSKDALLEKHVKKIIGNLI